MRDFDPQVGRWTTKDPIRFGGGAWNLYGYVSNDPINRTDQSGLCEDPGGSGTRICIETFIPQSSFGVFKGDNRGLSPNSGNNFRTRPFINLTPGGHGASAQSFTTGVSRSGPFARDANVEYEHVRGCPSGVQAAGGASDGLFFGAAPSLFYNVLLSPAENGAVRASGIHSAFPSLEIWMYKDGQPPTLVYGHNAPAQGFWSGTGSLLAGAVGFR